MNNRADSIYQNITKKEIIKIFCVGSLIGIIVFLACYGWKILDVTNDSWLFTGQDISQHYIGWKFYRASAWHFPIGQIDGIIYPDTSCGVSDLSFCWGNFCSYCSEKYGKLLVVLDWFRVFLSFSICVSENVWTYSTGWSLDYFISHRNMDI